VQLLWCTGRKGQETSEGEKPKGASNRVSWLNPRTWVGIPEVGKALERRDGVYVVGKPHEGHGVREGVRRLGRTKASEGKPQERDRDEIGSGDCEGSKASQG
jgi:hypothetical protein